jgi:amino acid adenylation domain-containing protein
LANSRDPAPDRAILSDIAKLAARCSSRPAITFDGSSMSYGELDRRSHAVARELARRGIVTGAVVAVLASRSLELPVVLLGIMRSGGAYLPLDSEYPPARLAQMLEDARPSLVIVEDGLVHRMPATNAPVSRVEEILARDAPDAFDTGKEAPAPVIDGRSPAYVIFTSGSTGRPKGVVNSHAGLLNRLRWMQKTFALGTGDVVLQKTPYGFDVSVWEFFWPFMAGARLVMAKPGGHRDPGYLAHLIELERVTVMHFVPSMLSVFLDQRDLKRRCGSLRLVVASGEALTPMLQDRFFAALPECELHNLYGPTEAAIDVTHWACRKEPGIQSVPIGYAIDNTAIHLLDERRNPVPDGDVGELYIGGVQVALGYVNRPDLTAERFLDDPFDSAPQAKLYRTGDLGRRRADGAIEFLGRVDHQIKLRGNRVELGEIETRLELLPSIKRAVVVAIGEGESQDLAAYVQGRMGEALDASAIRAALAPALPDYMIPRWVVPVAEFPVTANGKLDRAALPAPGALRVPDGPPPRDSLERFIAAEWCKLLSLEAIPRNVPFFELGGSSLTAARFVNRMQDVLGEFIYIVSLFDSPTVERYAELLKRDYRSSVASRFPDVALDAPRTARTAPIDAPAIIRFERAVPMLPARRNVVPPARNPPALFVLAPPRSGTTLLRVMLAGNPSLFAAAELQLLGFDTLRQREDAFSGKYALWLEGTIRAVMELKGCDADQAKSLMAELTERGLSCRECFGLLQEWARPRMIVDKSPSYALDPGVLARAEEDFDAPLYIHLVRHPLAMIGSFVSYHMNQVLYMRPHEFGPSELGELIWAVSHRNVLTFLDGVPRERQHRIAFEDLVAHPEREMVRLCERLGLVFDPAMVRPYDNLEKKMTDGLYRDSTPMGDTRFLERSSIDPEAAERWRAVSLDHPLGSLTRELAGRFGYDLPDDGDLSHRRQRARRESRARRRERVDG